MHSEESMEGASRLQRSVIRLITVFSAISAILFLSIGSWTQDTTLIMVSIGPALIAILGFVMLRIDKPRIVLLLLTAATIVVIQDLLIGVEAYSDAALVPLAIIGFTGALFVPSRYVIPYVGGYSALVFISRIQWSSGGARFFQATVAAVSVAVGTIVVTRVRDEFRRREERHRNLFEHAPVSLWKEDFTAVGQELAEMTARGVTDLEAHLRSNPEEVRRLAALVRVTEVNEAALRLTEAPDRSLLLGNFSLDTFSRGALESFIPQFLAAANSVEEISVELKGGLTMTGRPIEALLVWSAPRVDGERDLANVTVAIIDVTRQREAERGLQDLIHSQNQFVATISHELRTPLTAVVGIAEELRDANGSIDDTEQAELLGLVAEQGLEVSRIVDDLLVVARTDAGNLVVESRTVDLGAEALGVAQAIGPDIPVEVNSHLEVVADPHRVRQIIRNMVTNARRYGGPNIRILVDNDGPDGVLEVRDDGEPLAPASRSAIFEPYTRAKQGRKAAASVGLGLTVSRRLARHMGGDLTYDHDGREAIFRMTLTAVPATVATV